MSTDVVRQRVELHSPHRLGLAAGWLVIAAATVLMHFTAVPSASLAMAAFFAGVAVVGFLVARWMCLVLTPDGLLDRGLTVRRYAWADVQAIEQRKNIATQYVVLRTAGGQHHQLRLPTIALGTGAGRFHRDLGLLTGYWVDHRGPSWQPAS